MSKAILGIGTAQNLLNCFLNCSSERAILLSIALIINFGVPLALVLLGLAAGRAAERRHLRSLERRERELSGMLLSNVKTFPGGSDPQRQGALVMAEVVIATDYLKSLLAKIRKLLGGELKSYRSLMMRARREAMLRMMEQARRLGYNAICNVRLNPADIGGVVRRGGAVTVAICVTGTAYYVPMGQEHA